METVEHLRKLAELNFCHECFQKYQAFIEPTIQSTIQSLLTLPLADWVFTELDITNLVLKNKGVFKTEAIVIQLSTDEEKNSSLVDADAFRRIQKMPFKKKIDYLRKNGLLQEFSYELLDKARITRNRLHNLTAFSKEDYDLFHFARAVTYHIWTATTIENKDAANLLKTRAEKSAKQFLDKLRKNEK